MDFLARRNHSELELRQKLSADYPESEITAAIEFARESRWLLPPEELSQLVTVSLSRKGKGRRAIEHYLKKKGLPRIPVDASVEIEKGCQLVRKQLGAKLQHIREWPVQQKVFRLLNNRGYDDASIRAVLKLLKTT